MNKFEIKHATDIHGYVYCNGLCDFYSQGGCVIKRDNGEGQPGRRCRKPGFYQVQLFSIRKAGKGK